MILCGRGAPGPDVEPVSRNPFYCNQPSSSEYIGAYYVQNTWSTRISGVEAETAIFTQKAACIVLRTRGVPALNETDIRKLESIDSTCMKLSTTSDKLVKNHVISARQDHLKKESIAAVEERSRIVRFSSSFLPGFPGYISYSVKHSQ